MPARKHPVYEIDGHLQQAREAAKLWHGSPAGREWHSEHAKKLWESAERAQFKCAHCGGAFEAFGRAVKRGFCGMSCQGMARKKSGKDRVDRACGVCGTVFSTNKYVSSKCCSRACASKSMVDTRKRLRAARGGVPDVLRGGGAGG